MTDAAQEHSVARGSSESPAYSRLNDRYQILSLVGAGGMASVYKAHDEMLDREVAVKLFNAPLGDTTEVANQQHELQTLARLNHHGLVSLIDAGVVANKNHALSRMFLVMELITGPTLSSLIATRELSAREIAQIGFDLAEGLQYIHANGIVHRDVKPGNVLMVDYENDIRSRAKLADFGIALLSGSALPDPGETLGTAGYLSPEQAMRDRIEPASDVYSLGLSLLECFTRVPEFPGAPLQSATARLVRDPAMPITLSPQWATLLRAMTAREPADRPSSSEAAAALGELIGIERKSESRRTDEPETPSALLVAEPATDVFVRISRIASRLLNASVVIVAIVENGKSRILSSHGIDARYIGGSAILADPRDGMTPLVDGSLNVRRVTGELLRGTQGAVVGALWVLDERNHVMSAYDEQNLADVVALTESQLERS